MANLFVYHQSVQGYSHIARQLPCEDSSCSYRDPRERYCLAIVADGHGQSKSFRSQVGSRIATEVARECLCAYAEVALASPETEERFYRDLLHNPRYRQMSMGQLTDTILARWCDSVLEDYESNPPTDQELGEFAQYYQEEEHRREIYGTTLIAALQLPRCLILIHNGDGRCDVFYGNGTVDQPIPWDQRCQGNATTSLCDADAATSFRHQVIDLIQTPVAACYLGSDGVEDAYRNQEGTHTFYRYLTCLLLDQGQEEFVRGLEELLSQFSGYGKFSPSGSLDDVSVAGILDLDLLKGLQPQYQREVEAYQLQEALFWKEDQLRSKNRGHGILLRRLQEARDQLSPVRERWQQLRQAHIRLCREIQQLDQQILDSHAALEQEREGYCRVRNLISSDAREDQGPFQWVCQMAQDVQEWIAGVGHKLSVREADHSALLKQKARLEQQLGEVETQMEDCQALREQLQTQEDQAREAFEAYDSKYRAIQEEIAALQAQIAQTLNPQVPEDPDPEPEEPTPTPERPASEEPAPEESAQAGPIPEPVDPAPAPEPPTPEVSDSQEPGQTAPAQEEVVPEAPPSDQPAEGDW